MNYDLLLSDINYFNKIANSLLILKEALETKLFFEYPKLIDLAKELIALLEKEYQYTNDD